MSISGDSIDSECCVASTVVAVTSGTFASSPSFFASSFSFSGSSLKAHASFSSPRIVAVIMNDKMHAGLRKVCQTTRYKRKIRANLRYSRAGCAALNVCITAIVVTRPATYAVIAAVKYGLEYDRAPAGSTPLCARTWRA